jgi:hypothetical protein
VKCTYGKLDKSFERAVAKSKEGPLCYIFNCQYKFATILICDVIPLVIKIQWYFSQNGSKFTKQELIFV